MILKISLFVLLAIIILSVTAGIFIGYSLDFLIRKRNEVDDEEESEEGNE